jgi:hypothetical protein
MLIDVVRGMFVAENYWEWKQLITASFSLSLPIFVYVFSEPDILTNVLKKWLKIALPAFFVFFIWCISRDAYHFYLGPILLLSCFLPVLSKKWKIILFVLLILMIFADFSARSQVIKAIMTLVIVIIYLLYAYRHVISLRILYVIHWSCYLSPVILLILGITNIFNPFEALSENARGKYIEKRIAGKEEDLSVDTRTFIYEEVIVSAIRHHYVWQGRTPARGNDSYSFGAHTAKELQTGKYERYENEVCHANVFTWLGLIGVMLYGYIYLKSSYLALYKSNNLWMKLLGIFIAFRWAYGWIEDCNRFDIMNISLWMMIAMGFSVKFREMNNIELKKWVVNIL